MRRKKSTDETRIWFFHALAPTTNSTRFHDLVYLGNRYYNALVEIGRDRLESYRKTRAKFCPGLNELEVSLDLEDNECADVMDRILAHRQRLYVAEERKSRETPPELATELEAARARRKAAAEAWAKLRDPFEESLQPARDELRSRQKALGAGRGPRIVEKTNAEVLEQMLEEPQWKQAWKELEKIERAALEKTKLARSKCDLPDGCYNLVERAVQQAFKDARPEVPGFKSFRGNGRVGVQIKKPLLFADVLGGRSEFVKLRQAPPKQPSKRQQRLGITPSTRHSEEFFIVSLRIGSDESRRPVWAEIPVRLHRLPPLDTNVKYAWIKVRRDAGRYRYELQLTLERSDFGESARRPIGEEPEIRARFCSELAEGGYRVCQWACEATGESGEIVLPTTVNLEPERPGETEEQRTKRLRKQGPRRRRYSLYDRLRTPSVLRGHADVHYEEIRDSLGCSTDSRSDRVRVGLARLLDAWTAERFGLERREELWRKWRRERLTAERDLFCVREVAEDWMGRTEDGAAWWAYLWTRKDQHLRETAANLRRSAEFQRDALYRREAIRLATRYSALVTDDQDLSKQKRRPRGEQESDDMRRVREIRQLIAPGRCREILRDVFRGRHRIVPALAELREQLGANENAAGARYGKNDGGSEAELSAAE